VAVTRRRRRVISAACLLVAAGLALGLYAGFQRVTPLIEGSGCDASSGTQVVSLNPGQAGIAATIAGVALRDALPSEAVTVAYAAALQESKLQNLPYGDRDSVGVFQQRPSEGWGTRSQLEDPVYASSKFFSALVSVPGYQQLPVYEAAQDVQRSADGYAYEQYQPMAAQLSGAFTGEQAHAVWCWYPGKISGTARVDALGTELAHTFGAHDAAVTGDPEPGVLVAGPGEGWAVAAWLVSHAQQYRVTSVRYGGYAWSAADGARGWAPSVSGTGTGSVLLG
jgi:hypothetical protein